MFVKKRRKTMTYNKPEVVKFDSAVKAIQGSGKPSTQAFDSTETGHPKDATTPGAYEADE